MAQLVLIARLVFGATMLASGLNFFVAHLWAMPTGHAPLAAQLMAALAHSQLLDVAMGVQLVAGLLILTGLFVPLALCVMLPISLCAAYWAVILEHRLPGALLALFTVALNALLMLAWLDDYRGVLARYATTLGEAS